MIEISRGGPPVILDGGVAEILVKDEFFKILSSKGTLSEKAREALLDDLKLDRVVVGRLGKEVEKETLFERNDTPVQLVDILEGKELGYYHRL